MVVYVFDSDWILFIFVSHSDWIMVLPLYTIAKAIGGLGQLAGAAQYVHRQYSSANSSSGPRYRRRYIRMRPSAPYRKSRRRYRRSRYVNSRYSKRMPMLRPRLKYRLKKAKYAPVGGTKKFKTVILNLTKEFNFLDDLNDKKTDNTIHYVDPLNDQWIPYKKDCSFDKSLTWEGYEQCRLKHVIIELRNFNERRLIKYSDDRVEEKAPTKMNLRYFWDSIDMLGDNVSGDIKNNFNKLNKKRIVYKSSLKPSFTYTYTPKYHLNEGWCEFQNKAGFGAYESLADVYAFGFEDLMKNLISEPVTRFVVNNGDTSAVVSKPQFFPRFWFSHELEYSPNQFDKQAEAYIQDIAVHMNCEINIKSVWEFKNPRVDQVL